MAQCNKCNQVHGPVKSISGVWFSVSGRWICIIHLVGLFFSSIKERWYEYHFLAIFFQVSLPCRSLYRRTVSHLLLCTVSAPPSTFYPLLYIHEWKGTTQDRCWPDIIQVVDHSGHSSGSDMIMALYCMLLGVLAGQQIPLSDANGHHPDWGLLIKTNGVSWWVLAFHSVHMQTAPFWILCCPEVLCVSRSARPHRELGITYASESSSC